MKTNNKTCIVTGANSGIGKETAMLLAKHGARVIMVCRDRQRGESARREIVAKSENSHIELMLADFSSQQSIFRLAEQINANYNRLDVLINNAGLIMDAHRLTEDGIETTFAVNHLGYFLLTLQLLDLLKASAPARIINVASRAHRRVTTNFETLEMDEKSFKPMAAYARSKLANILFTYELARRLRGTGVTANCLHPGVVATNFGHTGSRAFYTLFTIAKPLLLSAKKAAQTPFFLAISDEVEGVTGKYFVGKKQVASSPHSYDHELQKQLWQRSLQLTGL